MFDDCLPPFLQGLTEQQLQVKFTEIQTAIFDLAKGGKAVSLNYAQGDGAKAVTYTAADLATLNLLLRQIGAALGFNGRRRAIAVRF